MRTDWYLAAEGVFVGALILLLLALVVETLFACCHCCLRRSCVPSTVASLTIASGMTRYAARLISTLSSSRNSEKLSLK